MAGSRPAMVETQMRRRDFLGAAAALPVLTLAGRLAAAPVAGDTRLLVVFLRGGYDAANVIVPVSSDFYYQARPTLAIAKPDGGDASALRLDADWGLHPALKDTLYPLFAKKQAAFIPFAGTDDVSRSHFETQDSVELGQPPGGAPRDYNSGFMARLVAELVAPRPIAFTDRFPLIFRGPALVPNIAVGNTAAAGLAPRDEALIAAMYQGSSLAPAVAEGFAVQSDVYRTISQEMAAANRGAVSPRGFSLAAERVAALMRAQFNVGFIDVGGWDTHVNEGGATGYLANRLGELGAGLAAFAAGMGPAWNETIVVAISEFGRTFRENGARGTDHGHGSVAWLLGGAINGGGLLGAQVAVSQATLFQNRDYPVLNEYRGLLAGLFQQIYGLSPAKLDRVFPQAMPLRVSFV